MVTPIIIIVRLGFGRWSIVSFKNDLKGKATSINELVDLNFKINDEKKGTKKLGIIRPKIEF